MPCICHNKPELCQFEECGYTFCAYNWSIVQCISIKDRSFMHGEDDMYFLAFNDAIIVPWLCMCLCHIKHTRPHTHTHHPKYIQKKGTRYTLISFHLTLIHTKISTDVLFTGYWIAREQCYYLELKFCFFCDGVLI